MFNLSWLQNEWAYFTGAYITIFFIIDPFAAIPVLLTLTDRYRLEEKRLIIRKATLIALSILLSFAMTGMKFFTLFGITLPAFQIAGGILLLSVGTNQLNSTRKKVSTEEEDESLHREDITIFPLATPLLAGPGAISTVILLSTGAGSWLRLGELIAALILCMGTAYGILQSSHFLKKILGKTGLNLLSRIMGMVLTAIAVQFIINGIKETIALLPR